MLNGQSDLPRALLEVEFQHRSVAQAHAFVLQYFQLIPVLPAGVSFVFWEKRTNGTFAVIAVLHRRNGAVGKVRDAVSFGCADVLPTALLRLLWDALSLSTCSRLCISDGARVTCSSATAGVFQDGFMCALNTGQYGV